MVEIYKTDATSGVYLKNKPPLRVLVVDDDDKIRKLLVDYLSRRGYHVSAASDGREALNIFSITPFDIVIIDMFLPGMDSFELINHTKAVSKNVDVIAMTGYVRNYRYADIVRAGATDFVVKPFDMEELEAKVERIVRDREERAKMVEFILRDALTGAYSRHALVRVLRQELVRAVRYGYPLSLLFTDIDNFKQYNDKYGHLAGDALLEDTVKVMMKSVRQDVDFVFRFGGDEFIVLLTNAGPDVAEMVAQRISVSLRKIRDDSIGISIGMAVLHSKCKRFENMSEEDLMRMFLEEADRALYEAKNKHAAVSIRILVYNQCVASED